MQVLNLLKLSLLIFAVFHGKKNKDKSIYNKLRIAIQRFTALLGLYRISEVPVVLNIPDHYQHPGSFFRILIYSNDFQYIK